MSACIYKPPNCPYRSILYPSTTGQRGLVREPGTMAGLTIVAIVFSVFVAQVRNGVYFTFKRNRRTLTRANYCFFSRTLPFRVIFPVPLRRTARRRSTARYRPRGDRRAPDNIARTRRTHGRQVFRLIFSRFPYSRQT